MTNKRFKTGCMIEGYYIGESMDLETFQEILEKHKTTDNIELFVTEDEQSLTYKEVVDLLNNFSEENEELKSLIKEYNVLIDVLKIQNQKLKARLTDLGVEYYG